MLEHFPNGARAADVMAALERDGATIVEGFLAPERVDALTADFEPQLAAVPWCNRSEGDAVGDGFFGRRTKRLHGLVGRSKHVGGLIVEPLLLAMCDHFLAPRSRDYRLSVGELMAIGEGEVEQAVHRDADSWAHFPPPRPDLLVSANIALTDFTESNGATVVVPGSHRWDKSRKPEPGEKAMAAMPRGSVLLYSGDVLHGGGANTTAGTRIGLYLGYILSWLRPIENHAVTSGLDAIRAAPERARILLDYTDDGFTVVA